MNYKKAHVISIIIPFLGVAAAIPFFNHENNTVFLSLALAGIAAGYIVRIAFCRCPNCRRVLFTPMFSHFSLPDYCPRCKEPLKTKRNDYI